MTVQFKLRSTLILFILGVDVYTHGLICYVCTGINSQCLSHDNGGLGFPKHCGKPESGNDVLCRLASKELRGNKTTYFKQCSHMIHGIEKLSPLCQLDDLSGGRKDILCFCKHDLCNVNKEGCIKHNKSCYDDGDVDNLSKKKHEPHEKHRD